VFKRKLYFTREEAKLHRVLYRSGAQVLAEGCWLTAYTAYVQDFISSQRGKGLKREARLPRPPSSKRKESGLEIRRPGLRQAGDEYQVREKHGKELSHPTHHPEGACQLYEKDYGRLSCRGGGRVRAGQRFRRGVHPTRKKKKSTLGIEWFRPKKKSRKENSEADRVAGRVWKSGDSSFRAGRDAGWSLVN